MPESPAAAPAPTSVTNPFDVPGAETPPAEVSSSSPPPAVAASPPPPTTNLGPPVPDVSTRPPAEQPTQRDGPIDPRVVTLRGMFPDYDDLILQSVLESVNWNQDRAVDTLLVMSDPDYRSEQPTQPEAPIMSQEQLDEQFARQLMLQEQQQQQQQWAGAHPNGPAVYHSSRPQGTGAWNPNQQQQPQSSGPNMGELQEQFTKIAETGKKTFGNLFSKVKAKIQELDTGRPAGSPAPSSSGPNQTWSSPGVAPGAGAASYYGPPQPQPQAQASYYDPNPPPTSGQSPSPGRSPQLQPQPIVQGYDVGRSVSPPSLTSSPKPTTAPAIQQPKPAAIPAPATAAQPIDAGKFGLLPKRPVSLLRDPGPAGSTPAPAKTHNVADDDDDGLEYAENPFEEGKK